MHRSKSAYLFRVMWFIVQHSKCDLEHTGGAGTVWGLITTLVILYKHVGLGQKLCNASLNTVVDPSEKETIHNSKQYLYHASPEWKSCLTCSKM